MKILSIGNSFSEDAHAYLHKVAKERGEDLYTVDLAIGGCSLERHYKNISENLKAYLISTNGSEWEKDLVTIEEIIKNDIFDVVTLQQVSGYSGIYENYQPYLNEIISYVRKYQPNARLYIHRTWAYEIDSTHSDFPKYDCDQAKMYKAICDTTDKIANEVGVDIILSGTVIQNLRERVPEFDYKNGKDSLCRDGFHLSNYGRYAAALTWFATLTGKQVSPMNHEDFDIDTIAKICKVVNDTVF